MTFQQIFDKIISLPDSEVEIDELIIGSTHLMAHNALNHVKQQIDPRKDLKSKQYKKWLNEAITEIEKGAYSKPKNYYKPKNTDIC